MREVDETVNQGLPWVFERVSVRAAPVSFSKGFKLYTYQSWFEYDEWIRKETWAFHLHTHDRIRVMAQFRLGSHWLAIQQARFARIPRQRRCCPFCPRKIEDELHLLECPSYAELREKYDIDTWHHSMSDVRIKACFNKTEARDWNNLAMFLAECRSLRVG